MLRDLASTIEAVKDDNHTVSLKTMNENLANAKLLVSDINKLPVDAEIFIRGGGEVIVKLMEPLIKAIEEAPSAGENKFRIALAEQTATSTAVIEKLQEHVLDLETKLDVEVSKTKELEEVTVPLQKQ